MGNPYNFSLEKAGKIGNFELPGSLSLLLSPVLYIKHKVQSYLQHRAIVNELYNEFCGIRNELDKKIAEDGFEPSTSGL